MDLTALLLSRIQFAFTVTFHIIFPSFTIGLAAWLALLEALHLATGRLVYRLIFEFWLKIFGVAFGLGVVSGVVMAFQLGTNWSELSRMSGPIQGPLLLYETFTAFALERPYLFTFPVVGVIAATVLAASVRQRWDAAPFIMVSIIFAAAYGTLDLVLALHDPVLDQHRTSGCAALQPRLHVLGSKAFCLPPHAALHRDQLQRLPG
jgi:Cytochrome bd terminal oxidase subunit I